MKSWERDFETHLALISKFVDLADLPPGEAEILKRELKRYMVVRLKRGHWIPASITAFHTEWYREFYRTVGVEDPYREIKRRSNELAETLLGQIQLHNLREAVIASIIANRLDFGVLKYYDHESPLSLEDFKDLANQSLYIDDFAQLEKAVRSAAVLVYLADNCGEVLFDLNVIREITRISPRCQVFAAAKSSPMLNDVTFQELGELGFESHCEIVSTGSNCFGVPEDEVSEQFKKVAGRADLIIAKGQANLEFWIQHAADNVFNLVYTKFPIVDANLGRIPAGENILASSTRYSKGKREISYGKNNSGTLAK